MARLTTTLVKRKHAWTGSKSPWLIDVGESSFNSLSAPRRTRWRLFHYLSGGGIRAFGSSVFRDEISRRQSRFIWFSGFLAIVWLVLRYI